MSLHDKGYVPVISDSSELVAVRLIWNDNRDVSWIGPFPRFSELPIPQSNRLRSCQIFGVEKCVCFSERPKNDAMGRNRISDCL